MKKRKPADYTVIGRFIATIRFLDTSEQPAFRVRLLLSNATLIVASRALAFMPTIAVGFFISEVLVKHERAKALPLSIAVIMALAMQALIGKRLIALNARVVSAFLAKLRSRVFSHALRLPPVFYFINHSSVLYTRLVTDLEFVRGFIGVELIESIGGLVTVLFAAILMFILSPALSLGSLLLLVIILTFSLRSNGALGPHAASQSKAFCRLANRSWETVSGIRVIKAYGAEHAELDAFTELNKSFSDAGLQFTLAQGVSSAWNTFRFAAIGAAIFPIAGSRFVVEKLSVQGYVLFTLAFAQLSSPIMQLCSTLGRSSELLDKLESVKSFLEEPLEMDKMEPSTRRRKFLGEIVFEDVCFSYVDGQEVLRNVSFRTRVGELTAIVGPSGAGKSTVLALVCRLIRPSKGRILLDGLDIWTIHLSEYRSHIGLVEQDTFLFETSIRSNMMFARRSASPEDVLWASKLSAVEDFASAFPNGLDTLVGQNGMRLSGGERQRIALARAIIADPSVLLLDEVSSNLDALSEIKIQDAMQRLLAGRSTLIVAHRMSTIRNASQILVLDKGSITQSGTHAELLATKGIYAQLYEAQSQSFN